MERKCEEGPPTRRERKRLQSEADSLVETVPGTRRVLVLPAGPQPLAPGEAAAVASLIARVSSQIPTLQREQKTQQEAAERRRSWLAYHVGLPNQLEQLAYEPLPPSLEATQPLSLGEASQLFEAEEKAEAERRPRQEGEALGLGAERARRRSDYQVLEKLGQGTFGVAYLVRERSTDALLVLKVIDWTRHPERRRAAFRELAALRTLLPGCERAAVCFEASFVEGGELFLLTRYLGPEYESLGAALTSQRSRRWSRETRLQLVEGLLAEVARVHAAGIVHRDIKPGNVLVNPRTGDVRLIDFGGACAVDACDPSEIVGTTGYLAPELLAALVLGAEARRRTLQRWRRWQVEVTDWWSAGLTALALLLNRRWPLGVVPATVDQIAELRLRRCRNELERDDWIELMHSLYQRLSVGLAHANLLDALTDTEAVQAADVEAIQSQLAFWRSRVPQALVAALQFEPAERRRVAELLARPAHAARTERKTSLVRPPLPAPVIRFSRQRSRGGLPLPEAWLRPLASAAPPPTSTTPPPSPYGRLSRRTSSIPPPPPLSPPPSPTSSSEASSPIPSPPSSEPPSLEPLDWAQAPRRLRRHTSLTADFGNLT